MAEPPPFLDTNILLRHLTRDVPDQARRATAYLARVERGEVIVRTTDAVIMETVFTLQRQYKVAKDRIRALLLPIIALPGIRLTGKRRLIRVFDIYVEQNVSFIDAFNGVMMRQWGLDTIVSFDQRIDRVPGINRVEP